MTDRLSLLRLTLGINAVATAVSGVALVTGAGPLAPVLGLPGPLPAVVVGGLFLAIAAYVWWARGEPLDLSAAATVLALDVAYVLAGVVLLLAWPAALSPLGRLLLALTADVVAVFAVLEFVGLRRARRTDVAARA